MGIENNEGFTLEKLKALECAIAEGALIVKYSDKLVEYRSLNEMLKIRDLMKRQLGISSKSARVKTCFSKGLC